MDQDVGLVIPILSNVDGFKQGMSAVKEQASSAMGVVKDAIGAAGLMAAGYLKSAVEAAAKGEDNFKDLQQTIKSTGGAAGYSADQIRSMAKEISSQTTFTTGEVMKGQNMLLTFTNIQGDVFKQASGAMMDMAQKFKSDAPQVAIQLGKALNDPVKGITALTRVGVSFTEQQKGQIKAMVQAGDVAGAQKVILGELNKEFGGQAQAATETYNGQLKQMSNNMNSVKSTIGSVLLPYLTQIAKHLNDGAQSLANFASKHKNVIAAVLSVTAVLGTFIGGAGVLQKVLGVLGPTIKGLNSTIGDMILPIIAVIGAITVLTLAYMNNWGGMRDKTNEIINFIKPLILNAFNEVVAWFKTNWPAIKATFEEVLHAIESAVNNILKPILAFMIQEIGNVVTWVQTNWPLIKNTVEIVMNTIKSIISSILTFISTFWKNHGDTIMHIVTLCWNTVKTIIDATIHVIEDIISVVMNVINGNWGKAWNSLIDAVKTIFGGLGAIIRNILDGIGTIFLDMVKTAYNWGANLISGFIDGIKSMASAAANAAHDVVKSVANFLGFHSPSKEGEGRHIVEWGANMIKGFEDGIRSQVPHLRSLMNTVIKAPNLAVDAGVGALSVPASSFGTVNNNSQNNYITINAKDIKELSDLVSLFNKLKQTNRAR